MPAAFHEEALKAQAIAARTYTIYTITSSRTHEHAGADICDNFACCQAWISQEDRFERWNEGERESNWQRIVDAVNATRGKIIIYNGTIVGAFYHANSGGKTETVAYVWSGGAGRHPYLQAVAISGEDEYIQYNSEVIISKEEVVTRIRQNHADIVINFEEETPIEILGYTAGGRVGEIRFGNVTMAGVEARRTFGLRSARFTVEIIENDVKFHVRGYGHGVGLSQTGADSLARQGYSHEEIIKRFYTGVEIVDM